jgi:DNA-binding transcriptional LysR family regulator
MFKSHHLELFYYVARYGGISAASRNIPYGIGQPAISGQMADFERWLGMKLFERKPFQLTEAGRMIYVHIEPCFAGLGPLEQQLRSGPTQLVRIAVDDVLGQEFLPAIITTVAPRQAGACLELQTGPPDGILTGLHERRVHLVITTADRRVRGVRSLVLARPGLRLLVQRKAKINSPGYFWRQSRIAEPLICPAEAGAVHRTFARGLQALGVEWPAGIRVDSSAVMMKLVAGGHGVGIGLDLPTVRHPEVRAIPLTGFAPVQLVALWRQPIGQWHESLLATVRATARRLWPAALPVAALLIGRWIVIADEFLELFEILAWE